MAQLDEGIEKLQEFNALLADVNGQVEHDLSALDAAGDELNRLEDAVEAAFDALEAELNEGLAESNQGLRDAVQEVHDLGEAARNGAESTLDEAEDDLEQAEEGFRSKLTSEGSELEDHLNTLNSDGFETLDDALDETKTDLQKASGQAESALQDLAAAAEALEPEVAELRNEAGGALQSAEGAFTNAADALPGTAGPAREEWTQAATDFDSQCDGEVAPVRDAYSGLRTAGEAAGDELIGLVETEASQTAEALGSGAGTEVQTAAETAAGEAVPALRDELAGGIQALETIQQGGDSLSELVEDLDVSERVCEQIDQALNTLE